MKEKGTSVLLLVKKVLKKHMYIKEKVQTWCKEIEQLTEIANSQPHAAFAAYIHGEQHRYTYFLRTIENMQNFLEPLDGAIFKKFLPVLFGETLSPQQKELLTLPIKYGGLGIEELVSKVSREYKISKTITVSATSCSNTCARR